MAHDGSTRRNPTPDGGPDSAHAGAGALAAAPCASRPLHGEEELGEEFWAGQDYCGYMRTTYSRDDPPRRSVFVNAAFARLAGGEPADVMLR